jgi:hypothetical protein
VIILNVDRFEERPILEKAHPILFSGEPRISTDRKIGSFLLSL